MSDHADNSTRQQSLGDETEAAPTRKGPKPKEKLPKFEFTNVEGLMFFNIVRFHKDPTAIDWEQVAIHSNLKNAASAKSRFRQIQKKYDIENLPSPDTVAPKAPGTASQKHGKSSKRKRNAIDEGGDVQDDDGSGVTEDTPSKSKPARKRNTATGGSKTGKSKPKAKDQKAGDEKTIDTEVASQESPGAVVKKDPESLHVSSDTSINPIPVSQHPDLFAHGSNLDFSQGNAQPFPYGGFHGPQPALYQALGPDVSFPPPVFQNYFSMTDHRLLGPPISSVIDHMNQGYTAQQAMQSAIIKKENK